MNSWKMQFFIFMFIFLSSALMTKTVDAKTIVVVYDDSGSMTENNKGSDANYSLQVVRGLLDKRDILKVVTLNNVFRLNSGNDVVNDINKIKNGALPRSNKTTPYSGVQNGIAEIKQSRDKDRWLIIITDGGFDQSPDVAHIEKFKKEAPDVKVICLGIDAGKDNLTLSNWRDYGGADFETTTATPLRDIMQKIAAVVTSNAGPDGVRLDQNGVNLSFTPPFPLRRFTILQQSNDCNSFSEIKEIKSGSSGLNKSQVYSATAPGGQPHYGRVIHVENQGHQLILNDQPVTITLDRPISKHVKFVILPEVDARLRVDLYDHANVKMKDNGTRLYKACLGRTVTIKARLDFHNTSAISHTNVSKTSVSYQYGADSPVNMSWDGRDFTGALTVKDGTNPVKTKAVFEGYINIFDVGQIQSINNCSPRNITFDLQPKGDVKTQWKINVNDIGKTEPFEVIPKVDGKEISKEDFKKWDFAIEPQDLAFSVKPSGKGNSWYIQPELKWCTACFTRTGSFPVQFSYNNTGGQPPGTSNQHLMMFKIKENVAVKGSGDRITLPDNLSVEIEDPGWIAKCWKLVAKVLLVLYLLWHIIGIIKKPRFGRSALIEWKRSASARGMTHFLRGPWYMRWILAPYKPERKVVEGMTFIAGLRPNYILVSKDSLTQDIRIDGTRLDNLDRDVRLDNGSLLKIDKRNNRYETFKYEQ